MSRLILLCFLLACCWPLVQNGSDSDEALEWCGQRLLSGQEVYRGRLTHCGNPMTPTIGYVMLYLPFCMGASHVLTAAISLLWIASQPCWMQFPLLLCWLKIGLQGNDYVSNAVLVTLCLRACLFRTTQLASDPSRVRP